MHPLSLCVFECVCESVLIEYAIKSTISALYSRVKCSVRTTKSHWHEFVRSLKWYTYSAFSSLYTEMVHTVHSWCMHCTSARRTEYTETIVLCLCLSRTPQHIPNEKIHIEGICVWFFVCFDFCSDQADDPFWVWRKQSENNHAIEWVSERASNQPTNRPTSQTKRLAHTHIKSSRVGSAQRKLY